jgi:hypothetical protein
MGQEGAYATGRSRKGCGRHHQWGRQHQDGVGGTTSGGDNTRMLGGAIKGVANSTWTATTATASRTWTASQQGTAASTVASATATAASTGQQGTAVNTAADVTTTTRILFYLLTDGTASTGGVQHSSSSSSSSSIINSSINIRTSSVLLNSVQLCIECRTLPNTAALY